MSEWKEYQLSEIVELIGGGTPKTTVPEYWGGNIPWLSVTDFNTEKKYCFDTEKKITERGLNESSTKILKRGQIIISARGTVGVLSVLGRDMAFNQSCYGIDAKKKFTINNFLYYLLKHNVASLHSASYGAVFDTITKETFSQIVVSIPPLPEQRAIASILSSLDDKIDLLHRQNQTLEAMAEALFRQWFVEEADEGWEEGTLGDVIELIYGKGLKKEIRTGTGYPVIGSSGIVGYHSEFLVEGPGIVIGRKGTLGKVIYLWDNFFPIDTTYYIKSKVESAGLLYEYFLLKILNFEEMNSDSAVPGLNRDIALSTEIKIAPLGKLNKFNQFTSTFINKLRDNIKQIRTLEKLRDTMLPKLMIGEVKMEMEVVNV
jgi:type I restriction enzyme S subunit